MTTQVFESEVIRAKTPDGTLYLLVMENKDKSIAGFKISIGKAGAPVAAWASALAEIMTLAIQKGATVEDLLTTLSGITSDRVARAATSVCRSGPEGVWQALIKYRQRPVVDHDAAEQATRGASVAPWAKQRHNG
jgi:hypothetical protein